MNPLSSPITIREFRSLQRQVEGLSAENAKLRASLVHVARGGKLDAVTGSPLPDIHLSVSGLGRIAAATALDMLSDDNEDDSLTDAVVYCIAEASVQVLRNYRIPLFGSTVQGVSDAIQALHPEIGNEVARVLTVWRRMGGEPEYPIESLHCHVPAWKVLRNKGCNGLRQPQTEAVSI